MDALRDMLMPETPEEIEGVDVYTCYQPAEKAIAFGGDYYDFLPMDGGRWGIAVGDVSGKGVEAGRFTSMVKYVIRSFALERRTPGDVMTRANVALTAQMGDVMFVTVFFGILDTARRKFTYSCAGHPAALWLSHSSGEIQELAVGGGALGIDGWSRFDESSLELQPNDLIALYTDGIIEARRGDELYETERLIEVIKRHAARSLEEIAEAVMNDVREFADDHIHDDLALVLIRVKEE